MTYSLEYYFSGFKIPLLIILGLGFIMIVLSLIIKYFNIHEHKWIINRGLQIRKCIICGKKEVFNGFNFDKIIELKEVKQDA